MLPIIFILPLIQLLVLSNAASFEVKNILFSYVDNDHSTSSRELISKFQDQKKESDWKQIENLRFRISLLRYIQALGVLSLLLCTSSIFSIFLGTDFLSRILFGFAIILMAISLCLSLWEIHLSVVSLDIEIANIRNKESE